MASTVERPGVGRVFISYRREDTQHVAGRLSDQLSQRFGGDNVFMDVDSIEPGVDFAQAIEEAVASCDVLVALIGPRWVAAAADDGGRRLENPDDFVVLEIQAALRRNVRVIPVLVDGADMPQSHDLPRALQPLVRRNAVRLDHSTFRLQAAELLETIERVLGTHGDRDRETRPSAPAASTLVGGLPPPTPSAMPGQVAAGGRTGPASGADAAGGGHTPAADGSPDRGRGVRRRWIALGAVLVVVLAGVALAFTQLRGPEESDPSDPSRVSSVEANVQEFCDRSRSADAVTDRANVLLLEPIDEGTGPVVRAEIEELYRDGAAEMLAVVEAAPSEVAAAARGVQEQADEFVQILSQNGWSLTAAAPALLVPSTLQRAQDAESFDQYLSATCGIEWEEISGPVSLSTAAEGVAVAFGAVHGLEVTPAEASCAVEPLTSTIAADELLEFVSKNEDVTAPLGGAAGDALQSCIARQRLVPALAGSYFPVEPFTAPQSECLAEAVVDRIGLGVWLTDGPSDEQLAEMADNCQTPSDALLVYASPAPAPGHAPDGLGNDPELDALAVDCFNGALGACDELFNRSPDASDYRVYGDTCAGRQDEGTQKLCVDAFPAG